MVILNGEKIFYAHSTQFTTCIVCQGVSSCGLDICSEKCYEEYMKTIKELSTSN